MADGYDSPLTNPGDDRLGRVPFSRVIVDVATNLSDEWSVRIGVHGEWGSGKTTALNFAKQMLVEKGHLVLELNAWRYSTPEDFKSALKKLLVAQVGDRSLGEKMKDTVRVHRDVLDAVKEVPIAGAALAALAPAAKGKLEELGLGEDDFASLKVRLGTKRVVVFVDDLDRARPSALPGLFFMLREVVDLPGFSFVLAFDRERVTTALAHEHPGFDSDEFLDKIVEFPLFLSAPTRDERLAIAREEVKKYGLTILDDAVDVTVDLFPETPRRLRRFLRRLRTLAPEIGRHDADELNSTVLVLTHLLAEYAPRIAEMVSADESVHRSLIPAEFTRSLRKASEDKDRESINAALEKHLRDDDADERRRTANAIVPVLIALGGYRLAATPETMSYHLALAYRPCDVTNKEFRELFRRWRADADARADLLNQFVVSQAKVRGSSTERVHRELVQAVDMHRLSHSDQAAEASVPAAQQAAIEVARAAVAFARSLCFGSCGPPTWLDEEGALRLWARRGMAGHFRHAPFEGLRDDEDSLLRDILRLPHLDAYKLHIALNPLRVGTVLDPQREVLRSIIVADLRERLATQVVAALSTSSGYVGLARKWDRSVIESVFTSGDAPMWTSPLRAEFLNVLASAGTNVDLFESLYHLVGHCAARGDVERSFLKNEEILRATWTALIATPMDRRYRGSLRTEIAPQLDHLLATITAGKHQALPKPANWNDPAVDEG